MLVLALASVYGQAISITGTYVAPGGSIYGVSSMAAPTMAGGGNLTNVFNHAAQAWNKEIGDKWSLNIQYGWSNSIGNALAEYYGWWFPFGDQRHIQARILFNPKYSWFADATPWESSEYSNYKETSKNHGGGTINVGRNYTGANSEAANRYDLLSVATHEIGHSLSIGVGPRWTNEVADRFVNVTSPRYFVNSAIPVDSSKGHLQDPTALMWYGMNTGERRLISDVDLESAMQLSDFSIRTVPEPASFAVIAAGLGLLVRRKRKNA